MLWLYPNMKPQPVAVLVMVGAFLCGISLRDRKDRTGQEARSYVLCPAHHLLSLHCALLLVVEHGWRQALLSLPKDGEEIWLVPCHRCG